MESAKVIETNMELIMGSRGTGKTAEIIKECAKDRYSLIVCPNRGMCMNVFEMAQTMGLSIPMPITFEEFIQRRWYGKNIDGFYFDDLEMSLQKMAGNVPVRAAAIRSPIEPIDEFDTMDMWAITHGYD